MPMQVYSGKAQSDEPSSALRLRTLAPVLLLLLDFVVLFNRVLALVQITRSFTC